MLDRNLGVINSFIISYFNISNRRIKQMSKTPETKISILSMCLGFIFICWGTCSSYY